MARHKTPKYCKGCPDLWTRIEKDGKIKQIPPTCRKQGKCNGKNPDAATNNTNAIECLKTMKTAFQKHFPKQTQKGA